jgi:hypothetical protein
MNRKRVQKNRGIISAGIANNNWVGASNLWDFSPTDGMTRLFDSHFCCHFMANHFLLAICSQNAGSPIYGRDGSVMFGRSPRFPLDSPPRVCLGRDVHAGRQGFCSGWFEDVLSILSGKNKETELEDRRSRRIPTQTGLKTSQDIPRPLEKRQPPSSENTTGC